MLSTFRRLLPPARHGNHHSTQPDLDRVLQFTDHRTSFSHRDTLELLRALVVLRACSMDFLVDNSLQILKMGQSILGDRILGWILGPTVYAQFVAGEDDVDLARTAGNLTRLGLRLMVAPTLEEDVGQGSSRQDKYDRNLEELLRLADMTHRYGGNHPCLQTKITALLSADTLRNLSKIFSESRDSVCTKLVENLASVVIGGRQEIDLPSINETDRNNLRLAINRLRRLGEVASQKSLRLLVDAELSYVNPGCSLVTLALMAAFNQSSPVVANTYQCYFKSAHSNLCSELGIARELGACFAAKIVRGAYLERERQLDPDSNCVSHAATGQNYDRVVEHAIRETRAMGPSRSFLVVASHNEDSVRSAALQLHRLGLEPGSGHVVFAQIYGMAEQISMPLARAGYMVYKSVPMGPLEQVLPYLARRVAENRAVLKGARKERQLLEQELKYRLRNSFRRK